MTREVRHRALLGGGQPRPRPRRLNHANGFVRGRRGFLIEQQACRHHGRTAMSAGAMNIEPGMLACGTDQLQHRGRAFDDRRVLLLDANALAPQHGSHTRPRNRT